MSKFLLPVLFLALPLTLSACASFSSPDDPQKDGQYVSLVNRLTWINPLSGKRDGLRSSWPLKKLQGGKEYFPLAQIRQCDAAGACAWGVMSAQRKVTFFSYVLGGLQLDVTLLTDIARRQEVHQPGFDAVMAIPSDVGALSARSELARSFKLRYGEVQRIDLDYGVRFEVCALRYDAGGRALDMCDIDHL
ncbi:hypothetical protein [Janthinobacterium agaricidamnosum]|nr:hypothetical protein [Janthinobacterium agaricidamnosum]